MMPNKWHHGDPAAKDRISPSCPTEVELLQYLEGTLAKAGARRVQNHFHECTDCFDLLIAAFQNQAHPATEEELAQAEKLITVTPEQKVVRILELAKKIYPARSAPEMTESFLQRIVSLFQKRDASEKIIFSWARVAAFATILFALFAGGRQAWQYVQTDLQVRRAEDLLNRQHRIFIKDARLSGDYGSSGISVLMGEEDEQNYLQQAQARLEKALAQGEQSPKARQLLAQIFIIAQQYPAADSILHTIDSAALHSAALLNDRGVYYFQRQDWASAEKYFSEAIQADPKFGEARYNLALVKMQLGAKDEANAILDEYVQIEPDENWQNAARGLQDELRE